MVAFLWLGRNLKIGYFSQHHVDQLDLNISAVELLAKKFPGERQQFPGLLILGQSGAQLPLVSCCLGQIGPGIALLSLSPGPQQFLWLIQEQQ